MAVLIVAAGRAIVGVCASSSGASCASVRRERIHVSRGRNGAGMRPPDSLVRRILAGECVAFVGAGFAMPSVPDWRRLLEALCEEPGARGVAAQVRTLVRSGDGLAQPSARDLEIAGQQLEDALGEQLILALRDRLGRARLEVAETNVRRRDWLLGIPFAAILTTNFDSLLRGERPGPLAYRQLLGPRGERWWNQRYWRGEGPRVIKLHGDVEADAGDLVFTRRGYRARLYRDPGYVHALRAVLLTRTVLYLGCSFTDEYFSELRSEVLAYLGHGPGDDPRAYAIVGGMPDEVRAHYLRHEGIEILAYRPERDGHAPFDDFLRQLHERTSPRHLLGTRLDGRRLLWVDPAPQHNHDGMILLRRAAEEAGGTAQGRCDIQTVNDPGEAIEAMQATAFDLVITRWGHRASPGVADAIDLLDRMRACALHVPVVVFASGHHARENREAAIRRGALEYTSEWDELFEVIDRRFGGPADPLG